MNEKEFDNMFKNKEIKKKLNKISKKLDNLNF
jgi:hypothetical protein